jgi:hypothetical protein
MLWRLLGSVLVTLRLLVSQVVLWGLGRGVVAADGSESTFGLIPYRAAAWSGRHGLPGPFEFGDHNTWYPVGLATTVVLSATLLLVAGWLLRRLWRRTPTAVPAEAGAGRPGPAVCSVCGARLGRREASRGLCRACLQRAG